MILLDPSKAFDRVPHERLLLKLNRHGIDGPLLRWFRHFLTNRMQRVVIRSKYSDWSSVKSGVPQGTILGPILFIIYINDISTDLTSTVKIYADDTKIYRTIGSPDVDIPALQCDLDRLGVWANKWQMNFNPDKCEVMRITHTVEPPFATTSRKRPPLISDHFSKIPKVFESNHYRWNLS